jgi:photosystem II stability/assembly factor-like uncharacterized protein
VHAWEDCAVASERRAWYVGTSKGLFLIERDSDRHASARPLGLEDAGGFRAAVVVDCADPGRLYAGTTRGGILRSLDAGQTWQPINDGLLYKDVWSLVQHPVTGRLYAGTSPAGVFRSDDGGTTWSACESLWQLPSTRQWHGPVPPHLSRLKDLAVSAEEPEAVFGAIEEGWLVRSRDGGQSWEQIAEGVPHDSHTIRFAPGSSSTLVMGANDGMFRSTDGGQTWQPANTGLDGRAYTPTPLVTRATRPNVVFGSVAAVGPGRWRRPEGGDTVFCRSDDMGESWVTLTGGLPRPLVPIPRALAVDPTNPSGYVAGLTDGSVWATDDDGGAFGQLLDGLPSVMSMAPA